MESYTFPFDLTGRVREICKEKDISIREFEDGAGIKSRTYVRWNENLPSIDKIWKSSQFFGMTVSEFLGETKEPASDIGNGLSAEELELVNKYRMMNSNGRGKINEYFTLLSESDRYIKTYHSGQTQVG